jgi:hypothetical protein
MNQRRPLIERCFHVDDRFQALKIHLDQLERVLGLLAGLGHHRYDRFTLPAGPIDREWVLRSGLHPGEVRQSRHPRFTDPREVMPVSDHDDARHSPCGVRMDRKNSTMGDLTAPEHHMRHARQFNIVGVSPLTLNQSSDTRTIGIRTDVTRILGKGMQRLITLIEF